MSFFIKRAKIANFLGYCPNKFRFPILLVSSTLHIAFLCNISGFRPVTFKIFQITAKSFFIVLRKKILFFLFVAFFAGGALPVARAQAPYKHSFGATVGTSQAFSYKTFPCNHFAIQLDAGTKYCYVYGNHLWSLELAPNFMYEGRLAGDLYGFVGAGGSVGYSWKNYLYYNASGLQSSSNNAKGSLNGFFGLEYKLPFHVTLQFDFRPGYRCVFNRYFAEHIFDWGLNVGVRYAL